MDGHTIRRLTGWAAVGMVVFWAAQFPLYLVNDPSVGMYDGAGGAAEAYRIRNIIFTRILLDLGLYAAAMVFAADWATSSAGQIRATSGPPRWWSLPWPFGSA